MSQAILTEALKESSSRVQVYLVTISHSTLIEPIRLSNDATEFHSTNPDDGMPRYCTRSKGRTFIFCPFGYTPPSISESGTFNPAQMTIANADPIITKSLGEITEGATVVVEIIFADEPDIIQDETVELKLSRTSVNTATVTGTITIRTALTEAVPALRMTPANFPAAFKP